MIRKTKSIKNQIKSNQKKIKQNWKYKISFSCLGDTNANKNLSLLKKIIN